MRTMFGLLLSAASLVAAPMPRLVRQSGKHTLEVDGKPFIELGAQVHNSSGWPRTMEGIWPLLKNLDCKGVEPRFLWGYVDPDRGLFRFGVVAGWVGGPRHNDLRLILLW